jgi:hypothetical protein
MAGPKASDIARALLGSPFAGPNVSDVPSALSSVLQGLKPFDPQRDTPKDVGLGGPSTEYLAGAQDPWGNEFNYPRIWWMNGKPTLLSPEAAYEQALKYEAATGKLFPRYRNSGAADFAAQNRSALGGAENKPLAQTWPAKNF